MEASTNADPASELFAGLDECQRLPALDAHGTGGGLILMPQHIASLIDTAGRLSSRTPELCAGAVYSYLSRYILQCDWFILYECQREPLLEALGLRRAATVAASVLTGTPRKGKGKNRQAA